MWGGDEQSIIVTIISFIVIYNYQLTEASHSYLSGKSHAINLSKMEVRLPASHLPHTMQGMRVLALGSTFFFCQHACARGRAVKKSIVVIYNYQLLT